jgi:TrmH family RNA methyltransferase
MRDSAAPEGAPRWRERIHVVLVEPGDSRNVGAVARAMSNLGFSNLHLVAPPRYHRDDANTTACWAVDILDRARVHASLEDALAPMTQTAGFSLRAGHNRPRPLELEDWSARIGAAPVGEIALVFGPEDTGLRQEHVQLCRWLVRIPSASSNPSFNLAQSVLLALYEMARREPRAPDAGTEAPPPQREFLELDRIMDEVLTRARFYHRGTPAPMPGVIRHLIRRIDPDAREMRVLIGMFSKVNRALAGRVPVRALHGEATPAPAEPEEE